MKQLAVDLVILNERAPSYAQDLQAAAGDAAAHEPVGGPPRGAGAAGSRVHRAGRPRDGAAARRAPVGGARGAVEPARHPGRADGARAAARRRRSPAPRRPAPAKPTAGGRARAPDLELFNGLGGFAQDGREYVIVLDARASGRRRRGSTSIANPGFGFQVSESGSGYTWSVNSRENQLTAWSNDPVSDPPGETIYVRDEETRRAVGADGAADPRGDRALRHPARAGLHALRARLARHRARAAAAGAARRSRQDLASHADERVRTAAAAVRDRLRRVGARRRRAAPPRRSSSPRSTPRPGRCSRATRGGASSARASPSPISAARRRRGPPTGRSSSDATARRISRPRSRRDSGCRDGSAPASIPAARCRRRSSCPPAAAPTSCSSSARRRAPSRRER